MSNYNLIVLVSWIISHGYLVFFLAAFVEGVTAAIAGGVAASLGFFNPLIILALALAADLSNDVIYYGIGYASRNTWIKSHGHKFGLSDGRFAKLENLLHNHLGKAMLLVKLSPLMPIPGLLTIGSSRVPLRKFIRVSLSIGVPKVLILLAIGYFSGSAYRALSGLLAESQYFIWILLLLIFLAYLIYQRLTASLAEKIEKE